MRAVTRVRVAAVNDYAIIVAGLAALLARHEDRLEVVDAIVLGQRLHAPVDVALYDTYGRVGVAASALRELAESPEVARVAVFTADVHPNLVEEARQAGASGFISKELSGDEIAEAIVQVANGEFVVATGASAAPALDELDWPGRNDGLTQRESQVLALAADGLSNREIAAALMLSSETIKGYVSNALRKLGLRNRVQAATYVQRSEDFARHRALPG
jgi:DNA-binding NarL/FixJ family response regulator